MSALKKLPTDRPPPTVVVDTGLELGHLPPGHKLRTVLGAALDKAAGDRRPKHDESDAVPAFTAEHFYLHQTALYTDADEPTQRAIRDRLSRAMLHEAYFIEKAGLTFGAKMALLAPSTEERMLYALFAADEARHLHAVATHIEGADELVTDNPFHHLLQDLIDHGDRAVLVFIIQVVLEGWGLTHYRQLAEACLRPNLRDVLRGILEDEARHHGSGKVLVEAAGIPDAARGPIVEALVKFLSMVQAGPQTVLAAVDIERGGLSRAQKVQLLTDLGGEAQSQTRLALLKKLMTTRDSAPLLDELEGRGLFAPLPVADCV